jgi:hypothetical protein
MLDVVLESTDAKLVPSALSSSRYVTSCVDEVIDSSDVLGEIGGVFFLLKLKALANLPRKNCELLEFDMLKLLD